MKEQIKKALYTGLGMASLAFDKAVELGKEMADEFHLTKKKRKKLADDLQERVKQEKERISSLIDEKVEKSVKKAHLVTKEEFDKLKEQISNLEKRFEEKE